MDTKATATLHNGTKISGRLTTAHSASSYGQPVFVDNDGQAYNWSDIANIQTTEGQSRGGSAGTDLQNKARAANSVKGGWKKGVKRGPRKPKGDDAHYRKSSWFARSAAGVCAVRHERLKGTR